MSTRESILKEALDLFSVKGFEAVSMRDIAGAVGIKESSLYNHFKSKQDIFDSILGEYAARGGEFFMNLRLTGEDREFAVDARTLDMYREMTPAQFEAMSLAIFEFYFTDDINVKIRRMLTIEQYRSDGYAKLFRDISFDASIEYQAKLFEALMAEGAFRRCDPYVLALEFFAPIFLIFYKYGNDAESLKEAQELFLRHIRHFNETYSNGRQPE